MKILALLGFVVWMVAAWFTHLFVCFKAASWGFLIAGAIFFPVAVVHGTGTWFGAWQRSTSATTACR
ncbi:hypothetical protein [Pseudomonas brassicacearum]|uniref:hypothetical protein n=1 Tax=Pseudomonas brassicacearum TaxID=930166 RepID=UPI000401AA76|nr:hypothetical protein [Pseudomonas brassicacearum]